MIAHYQLDVEYSLMEAAEIVALSISTVPDKHDAIWIRGDELWRSPVVSSPHIVYREDWPILLQLRPADIPPEQFVDKFDQISDESNLLFILDFSRLTINDLKKTEDPRQQARRTDIFNGITAFSQNVVAKGHRVVIGLSRIALALTDWSRKFTGTFSDCFFSSDLYPSEPCNGQTKRTSPSYPSLSEVCSSLLCSNSYALNKKLAKELEELERRKINKFTDKDAQLKDIVSIASRLTNDNFLEPALRLEIWYKNALPRPGHCQPEGGCNTRSGYPG